MLSEPPGSLIGQAPAAYKVVPAALPAADRQVPRSVSTLDAVREATQADLADKAPVAALGLGAAALTLAGRHVARRRAGPRSRVSVIAVRAAAGDGAPAEDEVLACLKAVSDPGLGSDIVTLGFVADVKADKATGSVSFKLEVEAFQERAVAEVQKLPWVKRVELVGAKKAPAAAAAGAAAASSPKTAAMPPVSALDKVKNILAVSSCKGGVGKSTVSVNLAFELSKTGAKVGIFDCDVYGPSLPLMVGTDGRKMQMYQDDQGQKHIVPVTHEPTGVKLVSFGYAGKAAVMRGSMVTGLINQLLTQCDWGELDYLVLDMPPGTGDIHLTLAQVSNITAAVIVTTPQRLSSIDVERGISMFSQLEVPCVAVVQNMSYIPLPGGERSYPFGKTNAGRNIAEQFGIEKVFELPLDERVSEAGDTGTPFVTKTSEGPVAEEAK
eukprot:TRINITY_DN50246_c0_g1_i1.p1 TRINITY_DN50246_c0_g1~~TRINITY_DN50246_c0_g1_i1.p1  ORF type:complete len:439 (-),score=117.95 TRINITY_DN50246_c0_g1_i1:533-1849(-)